MFVLFVREKVAENEMGREKKEGRSPNFKKGKLVLSHGYKVKNMRNIKVGLELVLPYKIGSFHGVTLTEQP